MQAALRPYLTAGIAVVGAGVVAVSPVAAPPTLPDVAMPAVQLTAGIDFGQLADLGSPTDPLGVYSALATNSFNDLSAIAGERFADPAPILGAILHNQMGYFNDFLANPASIVNVPGEMFNNAANVFQTLTSFAPEISLHSDLLTDVQGLLAAIADLNIGNIFKLIPTLTTIIDEAGQIIGDLTSGNPLLILSVLLPAPIVLGLAAIGPLVNGVEAFDTSLSAVQGAIGSGEYLNALAALVAGPGYVTDAILNGQWGVGIDLGPLGGAGIPLFNGLLQPMQDADISLLDNLLKIDIGPFTGLLDGFVNYLPREIAGALLTGGMVDPVGSSVGALPLDLGALDLTKLLGDVLDPAALLAGLGGVLPAAASDLPGTLLTELFDPSWLLNLF
ncbi:hypothetical protein C1Y40_03492 [Mycobacterium talmoniae]|nr:hypothetical protein C1Y40_03492 [Mycobacterium talmoniae]